MQVDKEIKVGDLVRLQHQFKVDENYWSHGSNVSYNTIIDETDLAIVTKVLEAHDTYYVKLIWQSTLEEGTHHISRVALI